jgi:multiple sugar transport system permease protein
VTYPAPIEKAPAAAQIAYRTALPLMLALWLLPLAAVMLTSIRSIEDLNRGNFWGWPSEISFIENYAAVFTTSPMGRFVLNSFIITIPAVAGAIALACMAGFALAKYRFKGNLLLFATFIAGNFVPFQVLMIPVRDLTISLHLYDTYWALIAFHVAFQTGFCTLVMRNFIKQLPDALIEAARLDGMNEFGRRPRRGRGRDRSSCRWCAPRSPRSPCWCSPSSGTTTSGRSCSCSPMRCGRSRRDCRRCAACGSHPGS